MSVQIIERDGAPEWAVIPYQDYLRLAADAEMLRDVGEYDATWAAIRSGEEALIPAQVLYAILDGENPLRVWRKQRGLTQQQLADAAGISAAYLSQLESGKRTGQTEVLAALAKALDVTLEDVVRV